MALKTERMADRRSSAGWGKRLAWRARRNQSGRVLNQAERRGGMARIAGV